VQYAFGLFIDGVIQGVITYGQPASPWLCKGLAGEENRHNVIELNRLVIVAEEKNLASFLVGNSLRMLPKGLFVVAYADVGWGHVGCVYQATNWVYTGVTKARTDIFSPSGHARHHGEDKTLRQFRSAKHRYVFFTGDKKKMLKELRYGVEPYPKGESIRYDVGNPIPVDKALLNGGLVACRD
jgi:hypothetical protein